VVQRVGEVRVLEAVPVREQPARHRPPAGQRQRGVSAEHPGAEPHERGRRRGSRRAVQHAAQGRHQFGVAHRFR
jgi:hypothetical protein